MSATHIADALRQEILAGGLRPGEELQQGRIASQYGVSRIPVRDALAMLAAEKLVVVEPNRGAHVIALSRAELAEVFELRINLEGHCIAEGARLAKVADLAHLDYILEKSNLEAGRPGWFEGDWAFHMALYAPAGRKRHLEIIKELRQTARVHVARYDNLVAATPRWLGDHAEMVAAYKRRDGEACRTLIRRHLEGARDNLLAAMGD
jgi:DNA-binding GntR family transcriptional regulator